MPNRQRYISTTDNPLSGESIEMIQLAEAMGAEVVYGVPPEGLLVYMINLNLRSGTRDFMELAERRAKRRGLNLFIIGTCKSWEELEKWRPYFKVVKQLSDVIFVHHPAQIDYLDRYDIAAVYKPITEQRYKGSVSPRKGTVVYSGFLWDEKDIKTFVNVARRLPEWSFTIHVGQNVVSQEALPNNCIFNGDFIQTEQYLEYLAGFEYVWIPRTPTTQVYAGRSGISAVASGRPAILTDVAANEIIPSGAAIKYPHDWTADQVAELIDSRPRANSDIVEQFLHTVSPSNVWKEMTGELKKRGFADF
ncbi:MAG: glycosyltransferase [Deltaproteobacteria bacterium]|nr:glycosyltransferase [Deltaproteobacteria bacterium]